MSAWDMTQSIYVRSEKPTTPQVFTRKCFAAVFSSSSTVIGFDVVAQNLMRDHLRDVLI